MIAVADSPDFALVVQLQQRNPAALAVLYDYHGRSAYRLVVRIVGNRHTAEDLVQEVFLRLWTRAHLFDPERGELRGWILMMARSCALDYLRSRPGQMGRRTEGLKRAFILVKEGPAAWPLVDRLTIESALGQLTENQRVVLQLAYFEGMSQTEIAEGLHQPLGTVKTWTRTALGLLREQLRQVS